MTVTVLPRLPMSKHLRVLLEEETGHPVGLSAIPRKVPPGQTGPATAQSPEKPPYFILYPGWATTSGPPFATPDADAEWVYQVTAVADRGDQLEWMRDKVIGIFLARKEDGSFVVPIEVAGIRVMNRTLQDDAGQDAGDLQSALRFTLYVTPST